MHFIEVVALFIFKLIEKGWSVKKSKHGHNNFEMYNLQKNCEEYLSLNKEII